MILKSFFKELRILETSKFHDSDPIVNNFTKSVIRITLNIHE